MIALAIMSRVFWRYFMSTKKRYFKYLFTSIGSALILSIYSLVDTICVGQYHKEPGTAALGVTLPVWTVFYACALLISLGGASLMATFRAEGNDRRANQYFTMSIITGIIFCLIVWICLILFDDQILKLFGAKDTQVLDLAKRYVLFMKIGLPFYMVSPILSGFIRNDNAPLLATIATLCGGMINIILDITLVFGFDLGISGAGMATLTGQIIASVILISHLFRKKSKLKFVKVKEPFKKLIDIASIGSSSFVLDISIGILTMLINRQIVAYYTLDESTMILAIFGVLCNVLALVQSLGYAVGQACQPLLSESYGLGQHKEIRSYFKYGTITAIIIGVLVTIGLSINPNFILSCFMSITNESKITEVAPVIMRKFFLGFLILEFNVFIVYYFQAILKGAKSFTIALIRGPILIIVLAFLLPIINIDLLWYILLISEAVTLLIGIFLLTINEKEKFAESC